MNVSIWRDSLSVPTYISAVSGAILILHLILDSKTFNKFYTCLLPKTVRRGPDSDSPGGAHLQGVHPASFTDQMWEHIALHGGPAIFAHKVARFVGCAVFLGFSIATLLLETGQVRAKDFVARKHFGNRRQQDDDESITEAEWLQVSLCITAVRVSMSHEP